MQDESDQRERINHVRVEVKSFASRRLLQLAEIAHVQDQMRAITERLGNAVVKIGEPQEGPAEAPEEKQDEEKDETGDAPEKN